MGAASVPACPLLVGREVVWSTQGVQQGDPLGPFLFPAGIQAALDALPQGGALHRWYLDDGVFLGSVAEVEEVLGALRQTLPPLGLELNLRKTTVWGPGLVPASSPLTAATRIHLEEGTEDLGVPIHSPLYHAPLGTHLGTLKGKFARTCAAMAALADTQCAHALMRSCLGSAKVLYTLRTLPLHHIAVFAADVTVTQQATWDAVVGTPTSDSAWVSTTLPMSEGSCGFVGAADVAPVARLAWVMQFLARAELMLGCDRQLVVPLATEAGLLDALNARLPPALEPLASWTRTGKVELPDGDVRRQHWWSSRVTQAKAAALLEAATGRDVSWFEAQRAGKAGGWLSAPRWRARAFASPGPTIPRCSSGTWGCPCYQQIARVGRAPCAEGRWMFLATTPCHLRSRDFGIGTSAHKPFSARS